MTFFYDLNKKLDSIRDLPSTTHGQLNERANSKPVDQLDEIGDTPAGRQKLEKYMGKAAAQVGQHWADVHNKSHLPTDPKMAKRNAGSVAASNRYHGFGISPSARARAEKDVGEGLGDMARKVGGAVKRVASKALDTLGHGSDEDLRKKIQKDLGATGAQVHGKKSMATPNNEAAAPMSAKAKSFAALAEPKDKITFADKIAGAKKEVDEMLGDVAAEAMKSALSGGQKKLDKNDNGRLDANDFAMLRKGANKKQGGVKEASTDNAFTAHKRPKVEKPAVGTVTHGRKHDVEEIPGGRRVTRRTDTAGISVGANDEAAQSGEKRSRGRPKGPAKAPERVTGGATKHKDGRKMTKEAASEDDIQILVRMRDEAFEDGNKMLGNKIEDILQMLDDGEEQVSEKAVSKKQQKFMGMVHAAQKGEKPASEEVAKVAKEMPKKAAKDFASTKHKGLPEKAPKKKTEETVEETTTAGSVAPGTASKGSKGGVFGKGIYDSINREVEAMIAEGMNINMSLNSDGQGGPTKSLTVTATDEDAEQLAQMLSNAGMASRQMSGHNAEEMSSAEPMDHDHEESCESCGMPECGCGDIEEALDENNPDWPTEPTGQEDNINYYDTDGLNGRKTTGQTTVPVIASQDDRQESYAAEEEDAIKRMMEMAGIKEGKKPDFPVDNDGNEKESIEQALKDKKEEKLKEDDDIDADTTNKDLEESLMRQLSNFKK